MFCRPIIWFLLATTVTTKPMLVTSQAVPSNPCPKIFQYLNDERGNFAKITLYEQPLDKITLELDFSQDQPLGPLPGSVSLTNDLQKTHEILHSNKNIAFDVRFSSASAYPQLTLMRVNGEIVCSGSENKVLKHKFRLNHVFVPVTSISSLEVLGNQRSAGNAAEYPWIAALLRKAPEIRFLCGATLISQRSVLSAAHCFQQRLPAEHLSVVLASRNLKASNAHFRPVRSIIVHPDYSVNTANIALVILRDAVPFSNGIQPICLWPADDTDISVINGMNAFSVGWGDRSETREYKTVILKAQQCRDAYPVVTVDKFVTDSVLCGESRDDNVPCRGDSGNGLVMIFRGNYYLRGVLVGGLADGPTCSTTTPSFYLELTDHRKWIESNVVGPECVAREESKRHGPPSVNFTQNYELEYLLDRIFTESANT